MRIYQAAIIGCGRIAGAFAYDRKRKGIVTHAQAYLGHRRTHLVAACDIQEAPLRDFGRRWGVSRLYRDVSRMLSGEKIDLVSVCTPPGTHREIVERCAKGGVRGIICEKPIATTLADARSMIRVCRARGVRLLVHHQRRYWDSLAQIRRLLISNKIGQIQSVSSYYTSGLFNTGSHLFDYMRFLFGEAEWVWADPDSADRSSKDPTLSGYVKFRNGFGCSLSALDARHYLMFETDIYGTRGRLRLEDSGFGLMIWGVGPHPRFGGYRAARQGARQVYPNQGAFLAMVNDLIGAVEKGRLARSSGEDGLASLETILALRRSAAGGGKIIRLSSC